jgi:hypothetical protein
MENIKKKIQIVVARYNEDIKWLLPFKDIVVIYNKGNFDPLLNNFNIVNLKNYGRESHTYLYHIINNYDNLTDKVIFFQGKIDDHKILEIEEYFGKDDFIGKFNGLNIDNLKKKIDHFGKWKKDLKDGNLNLSLYTPYDWIINNIGIILDPKLVVSKVVWGANFSLSKELILLKPKIFYQNILRYIDYHINPEEGHFLERAWYLIFNNNYVSKKIIGYVFVENENIIYVILEEKNATLLDTYKSTFKPAILHEIINLRKIGNVAIDESVSNLFKNYEYIASIYDETDKVVEYPYLLYLCQGTEGAYTNVE